MALYEVDVELLGIGTILIEADNIDEARSRARGFGVRRPDAVRRRRDLALRCMACDSTPCVCEKRERHG